MEPTEREWKELVQQLKQINKTLSSLEEDIHIDIDDGSDEHYLNTLLDCENCGASPILEKAIDTDGNMLYAFRCSCKTTLFVSKIKDAANCWAYDKKLRKLCD